MTEGPAADSEPPRDVLDAFRRFGRARGRANREPIESAVGRLTAELASHGVDRGSIATAAEAVEASIPRRHREEVAGVASAVFVPESDLKTYVFGASEFRDALAADRAPGPGEGCSNVMVPADRSATGAPLLLKNRDVKSRGVRPQVILEAPGLGPYNGFLTVTTAGSVFVYQGVNEAGLAAANTFVDERIEDVPAEERLRNGIVVRDLLERCDTVDGAVDRVSALPTDRSKGLVLFLADGTDAEVLEIDPAGDRVERVADGVTARTNHFPGDAGDDGGRSSVRRLERLRELIDGLPSTASPESLDRIARDHRGGPGPNSVCRHPTAGDRDPNTHTESTTVSSAVFVGGTGRMRAAPGFPCERRPVGYELRGNTLADVEARAESGRK